MLFRFKIQKKNVFCVIPGRDVLILITHISQWKWLISGTLSKVILCTSICVSACMQYMCGCSLMDLARVLVMTAQQYVIDSWRYDLGTHTIHHLTWEMSTNCSSHALLERLFKKKELLCKWTHTIEMSRGAVPKLA